MKMNYLLSSCLFILLAFNMSAQEHKPSIPLTGRNMQPVPAPRPFYPLEKEIPAASVPQTPHPLKAIDRNNKEEQVGTTTWDAITYGCTPGRMYRNNAGDPVVNWLYSNQLSGNSDRGTANSVRTNGVWSEVTGRIEGSVRTGFPAAGLLSDGTEVVVAHTTAFTPYRLRLSRRAAGATTWTGSDLPQPAGIGLLWPQMAVGGADGKTVHVIAITTPVANTGVRYQNVDGHLLYWRSQDGGATWDVRGQIIAGLDSTLTSRIGADNYTIDAHDNYVAIAVFGSASWHDIPLMKSTDNGSTWNKIKIRDFPDAVENYNPLPGVSYAPEDLGPVDTLAPNQDAQAILTNDGHGALLIAPDGEVHAWFGRMYVGDADFSDSTSYYYPTTNGIIHWKESWGSNNFDIITGAFDYDGDGSAGVGNTSLSSYNNAGPSSFPSAGIDGNGAIYLTYAATNELYVATGLDGNDKVLRHVFIMRSTDNGDTWSNPIELTSEDYMEDFLVPTVECVFPAVPRKVDAGNIWVTYWQDFTPGSTIISNVPTQDLTNIMSVEISPADFPVGVRDLAKAAVDVRISPNPATDEAYLYAAFESNDAVQVEIIDLNGKIVSRLSQQLPTRQAILLPVASLSPGTYFVRATQGNRFGTSRLVRLKN